MPHAELDPFVSRLARAIARHPASAVTMTKLAVAHASAAPDELRFALEAMALDVLKSAAPAGARMRRFLDLGRETETGEADFARYSIG